MRQRHDLWDCPVSKFNREALEYKRNGTLRDPDYLEWLDEQDVVFTHDEELAERERARDNELNGLKARPRRFVFPYLNAFGLQRS